MVCWGCAADMVDRVHRQTEECRSSRSKVVLQGPENGCIEWIRLIEMAKFLY